MSENTLPETPRELREQADRLIEDACANVKAAPREPVFGDELIAEAYEMNNEARRLYAEAGWLEQEAKRTKEIDYWDETAKITFDMRQVSYMQDAVYEQIVKDREARKWETVDKGSLIMTLLSIGRGIPQYNELDKLVERQAKA